MRAHRYVPIYTDILIYTTYTDMRQVASGHDYARLLAEQGHKRPGFCHHQVGGKRLMCVVLATNAKVQ
jgi:hypothetical protein